MKSFFKELFLIFIEIVGLAMLAFLIAGTLANADQLRVAVLDTGLNLSDPRFKDVLCKTGHMDFTGQGLDDFIGHGTHVAGLIKKEAGNSKDYCLIIVKFYNPGAPNKVQDTAYLSALDYATSHAEIVNYSGGSKQGPNSTELLILNINTNTIIIAAAGNEGLDLSKV